jgi:hypothetical protein
LRFYYFIICTIILLLECFNVFFVKNKVVFLASFRAFGALLLL